MPNVVVDTNVLLTYLLSPDPTGTVVDRLLDAAASNRLELLLPVQVMVELNIAVQRPRLARRVTHHEVESVLRRVTEIATVLPLLNEEPPAICRDPKDDFLIAVAFLHDADFLVTQDTDLLVLDPIGKLRIIDPTSLLKLIDTWPGD